MPININALLKKKKWKGEEIGKALILNLVNDFKHKSEPNHKPLFSQSDLNRMTSSIETERDSKAYNAYINLYNGVIYEHNRAEANIQQAQNGYYRLLMYVSNAEKAENVKLIMKQFPLIMTEKQYKETVEKLEARRSAFEENYSGVFFHALQYYTDCYAGPKVKTPKPIKEALEALKQEPFTNTEILNAIVREYELGDCDEPLAGITKWDVIAGDYNMLEYYQAIYVELEGKEEYFFNLFIEDFPELSKLIKADIDAKLKKIDYPNDCDLTWGKLADANIYAYPQFVNSKDRISLLEAEKDGARRERAMYSGVAILRNDCITESNTDDNGYYKEPYSPLLSLLTDVDSLNADKNDRYYIEKSRDYLLIPALKEIAAYNALLEALADEYDVPELVEMKTSIYGILKQIEALNRLVSMLYESLSGSKEDIERKKRIVKDLFPHIDIGEIQPSSEDIKSVRKKLSDRKDASDLAQLITELASREKGAGKDG